MNLSCGIVGLPNAGKSTLFNALIQKQQALAASYPFATIEPNVGIVPVPDDRLAKLAEIVHTTSIIPSTIKFVDIAGIVKGAHKGEGLGNKFLSHIRETDLIVHVIRHFEDKDVVVTGSDNPLEDLETVNTELILADLQTLDNQHEPKTNAGKEEKIAWEIILKAKAGLEKEITIRDMSWTAEELTVLQPLFLLTQKPAIYVLNVGENQLNDLPNIEKNVPKTPVIAICAKLESELAEFTDEERLEYLHDNHLDQTGLDRVVTTAFESVGLISFLTAGEKEVRSWTIPKNTKAPQAAGVIHTDFIKGFIKANCVTYHDFITLGGWVKSKEAGAVRTEGKDYVVAADDVIEFMIGK
ncbi:redox-regulated ATPase YchF [Microgenomates group bacterium RIFCSPLOWO2_01_FULL_47_10]|nr:MAG: redox-regulated ATPase YchF [Microgenomates group bacterium RIFCSPLOWO2_01_FULL_47_10]